MAGVRIKHESFGIIHASRMQGRTRLFDSALEHQHYVSISICHAEQERRHSDTHVHGRDEIIRVAMSEAQFAQFITSMNVGTGAPCTLARIWEDGQYKAVPEPPADVNTKQTFDQEMKQAAHEAVAHISRAGKMLERLISGAVKMNKTELGAVLQQVRTAERDIGLNMPFVLAQFVASVERITEAAKSDLNAYGMAMGKALDGGKHPALPDAEPI